MPLPEALDPLGQRSGTPAERRVRRRFVSAPCLVAGHDAFGQGVCVEVPAQARHSVCELAHVYADERPLFCPGQLFFMALHAADSPACRALARMPCAKGDKRTPPVDTRGSRSERDRRHSLSTRGRI